jgi:nitroreductase
MTYDELLDLLKQRRSVRYFSDAPIEKDVLEKVLNAGILAPSVENLQPWKFHVITNPALKAKMMEHSCYGNFVAGSGTFIVVTCDRSVQNKTRDTIWNPRELEYSCATAMNDIMLAAATINIGSCWVSLHHGPVHNLLQLKDHQTVVGGIMLGIMKPGEEDMTGEHVRHPLKDTVIWHE